MTNSRLANEAVSLTASLLVPAAGVFRTIKLEPDGERFENDAEHSFLLATLGCALAARMRDQIDVGKVAQYALVHDLVEVYAGDTSIWDSAEKHASKAARESKALNVIRQRFGSSFGWVDATIAEYEQLGDPESRFVYALDKITPYIVMLAVNHQPYVSSREVFEEKMGIARAKVEQYPPLVELLDEVHAECLKRSDLFVR